MLNERFFWYHRRGLPFVAVKVAQTLDGRIADVRGRSRWITGREARIRVHELRSEYDAVLVGAGTVLQDDPELTVRHVQGRNPLRVVVDGRFRISERRKILRTARAATMVVTTAAMLNKFSRKAIALERRGVQVLGIRSGPDIPARSILRVLAENGVTSVLVEGGMGTWRSFIEDGFVNKLYCFIAPSILGSGVPTFALAKRPLGKAADLSGVVVQAVGSDILLEGTLNSDS
jgi:diaminohydroxyphosphoribosylaminopyrimidine deaminase/5-amino-6-(5-phosphoribosylamino)uracil reductase